MILRRALLLASSSSAHYSQVCGNNIFGFIDQQSSSLQQTLRLASNFSTNMTKGAVISLSHGGGPMPLMGDPSHKDIVTSLRTKVPKILKLNTPEAPRAIVLVTAHWSEARPTISSAEKHSLYYDYYGFPPETYKLKYDAPGSTEVAEEVYDAFAAAGLKPQRDLSRGKDNSSGS
jgi:aromatic ring-opening dioxygenase catalytic subunit (LigB family)